MIGSGQEKHGKGSEEDLQTLSHIMYASSLGHGPAKLLVRPSIPFPASYACTESEEAFPDTYYISVADVGGQERAIM